MRVHQLKIERFRGIGNITLHPGARTVVLGPNNAGKTTILEALDLLFHAGRGRARPALSEVDYYARKLDAEFSIEAVLADVPDDLSTEATGCFEGWHTESRTLVPEIEGDGIEPVLRVRVRGTRDLELKHEFAKEEVNGRSFGATLRAKVPWIFDGRVRDPAYQLGFYQGGLLDRLFEREDMSAAVSLLRDALTSGASKVNADTTVAGKLSEIAEDLRSLGLITQAELPLFEIGAVSQRELLQSLRLALPEVGVSVPLARHGRGTQRLLLVAVLLRLARNFKHPIIGGFEEPEEALEPMRQLQMARTIAGIADSGGQVFVVTHSPEVARSFAVDDFVLLDERAEGANPRILKDHLDAKTREKYERHLDAAIVRGLFAKLPVLLEGPSDRGAFEVFWREALKGNAAKGHLPREALGIDFVALNGYGEFRNTARLLSQAGKRVVAVVEGDQPDLLTDLRSDKTCSAILKYQPRTGFRDLEQLISQSASIPALIEALKAIAIDREISWERQRDCLIGCVDGDTAVRYLLTTKTNLGDALACLAQDKVREVVAKLLQTKDGLFNAKNARPARLVAEAIVSVDGAAPKPFETAIREVSAWASKNGGTTEFTLAS